MKRWAILLVIALLVPMRSAWSGEGEAPASNVAGKKMIRASEELAQFWGAGSMAKADLPAKIAALQEAGYDGLVFSFASHKPGKGEAVMTGQWWSVTARTYEEFAPEVEAFRSVKEWGRITDNFTRTMPAVWGVGTQHQDWFNDAHWEILLNNARVLARVVKDCGFKGIILDTEQYAHHGRGVWRFPFNYKLYAESGYKEAGEKEPHSFQECVAKVRERAQQYGEAITEVYPDLVFFVIPGLYETTWNGMITRHRGGTLADSSSSLYPAFVDGLLVGLDERAKVIAGTEATYLMSQYKDMLVIRDAVKEQSLIMSSCPATARERITFSVGIWTDAGYGKERFSNTDVSANQRDPARHLHAVHNALAASDEYAWQWGEMGDWLSPNPTPLIGEYWKANVAGHEPQDLAWEPVPKWDMADYGEHNGKMAEKDAAFWKGVEKGGWTVAVELPTYWHFFFDTELLLRFGDYLSPGFDERAWPFLSTLACWQSQSVKANGPAVYRVRFDAPDTIDPERQEVVLAFGAFPPDDVKRTGWMDVHLNGKGYPIRHLIDVTPSIKPGEENILAVRVINKAGPGGLTGHVKLLVRGGAKEAEPPAGPDAETIFGEDFEGYKDGTLLSEAGWTTERGDVKITRDTRFGKATLAIDGKTPTKDYVRGTKPFSAPVRKGDTVVLTAKVYPAYGSSWTYVGLHTTGAKGVTIGNNGWEWALTAQELTGGDKGTDKFWSWNQADPWDRELLARIIVDGSAGKVRATLTDAKGTVHESAEIRFPPGAETKLKGVIVYPTNTAAGKNMDIDDIKVTRRAKR